MALSHDGYDFESVDTHGDVVPEGAHELRDTRKKFFDVEGESEIRDSPGGRNLTCRMMLRQHNTAQDLIDTFNLIQTQANTLTGTLTVSGNLAATFGNCTFKGAVRGRIIRNAVDDTYQCPIILIWRQHIQD